MNTMKQSVLKNAWGLSLFAMCTAGLIAITQWGTFDLISVQALKFKQQALFEIFPETSHDNDLLNDTVDVLPDTLTGKINTLNTLGAVSVHRATQGDNIIGVIIPTVAPDAYTEAVKILVGIHQDGTLAGVRVISHKETPGLGDKIDLQKSNWILSFNNLSFETRTIEKWKVKKDGGAFDQFTGATITPRAIVKAVKNALSLFHAHRTQFLDKSITVISTTDDNTLTSGAATHE